MTLSTVIKAVQDIMRQDAGVDGDAQRISQLVWMIFLKILDAQEQEWEMMNDKYVTAVPEGLRWRDWADNEEGITGDALLDFVNSNLFKGLKEMELDESSSQISFLVREVFSDSYNYMKSGTLIRQVINKLNEIDFTTQKDRHQFNDIYETILRDLQSAGNAGEFYTPRPVTQFIVDMINPQLGEKVLDPACGTGGFLISALENLKEQTKSIDDVRVLQESVLGTEKKSLPYLLSVTNMILHGIDVPKIRHDNSLSRNVRDYSHAEKVDVVITNPPFGGIEEDGITINFPTQFRTKETADLFMVLLMYLLKGNGRAGIVLPDGFLFGEGIKTRIKEKLLGEFNLHTIVRLPNGVFAPYTDIKTNLLFFNKGDSTKEVWYYEHQLPEGYKKYTKTKPIKHDEFEVVKQWWQNREETEYAWKVSAEEIKEKNYNFDLKNPHKDEIVYESPEELLLKYHQAREEVQKVRDLLKEQLKEVIERG
jgi:type I restriction enzyme M protein